MKPQYSAPHKRPQLLAVTNMRPSGTVTFLMSDIEGSTRLLRTLGVDRYEGALQAHRALLREAFARFAGFEVGSEGDSFFVAFGRAQDAVNAAVDAQCALAGHAWQEAESIRVRIGIHTCEATVSGDNYVGIGVHRTARISATGHGCQIVLSQATRELLQDDAGIACVDLGLHPLKDFEQPQRLLPADRSAPAARISIAANDSRAVNQYRGAADGAGRT